MVTLSSALAEQHRKKRAPLAPALGNRTMKALCWHGKGDMRYETVPDPKIQDPRDAIILRHLRL